MKIDERDDRPLDEMLRRSYQPLARQIAEERLTVLADFDRLRAKGSASLPPRHVWRARVAWLAAASILVAIGVKMFLIPSSSASVYALETAGRRLCEVQTIRVRGARYVRHGAKPDSPLLRVPIEHLIKRPDKFSHTWWGISQNGDVVKVGGGTRVCDGRHQTTTRDTEKQFTTTRINPIDARLTTETFAQWILRFAVLGPPEARYKKIGRETAGGRDCDIYEARTKDDEDQTVMSEKVWFDPASGYPVRKIVDRILPDGKIEHDSDYSEISVNVALADELFTTAAPAGYERLGDAPEETATDVPLNMASTGCCSGGFDQTLAAWHTFRIADNAALVIWRRSVPKPAADGTLDWLSQMEMTVSKPKSTARHAWLYQSGSPEVWNWSLVAAADRELPDPGIFEFKLVAERFAGTLGLCALRFPDDQLEQILTAAAAALPDGAPRYSLAALRAKAVELSKR